ncbi:helix-turn-helix domain-containing protein [Dyadobacter chenwenxiniae]|uniref:Helix-turn-helix domain-containing protein n=1 Tax=Dyadobacter chenwenxiniae TaxID=2906456 RepID=A0A9X1PKZ1_9BACT|nr:helix-turn-helix domain-containing protein [Dyadobacter chenwenxiniae]MCF0063257.1 helix-turn-helix domain-containing protein [Dyadobacter chenwenxiniae]UON85362.1 helix-turn-helix domain-containing protein [Dyadobacter chenwenxiniae]
MESPWRNRRDGIPTVELPRWNRHASRKHSQHKQRMSDPLLIGLTTGGAFLLAFLLFTNPKNNNVKANHWLGAFIFTFGCAMLEVFLHNLHLHSKRVALFDLIEVSRFLSAPMLYLSVVFFTATDKKSTIRMLWHFVLFAAVLLFRLPHMVTGENVRFSDPMTARVVLTLLKIALPIQTVVYWGLSYRKLIRHRQNIEQVASSTDEIDLSWLQYFLWVLAAVVLVWLNLAIFNFTLLFHITPFLYLLSVYFLAYFALQQKEIYPYSKPALRELDLVISAKTSTRSEKQKRLTESQASVLKDKLAHLMQAEKVYLDSALSLPVLAQKMSISIHELSYLINEVYGQNFFSFVNGYRIEEAKRLLLSEEFEKLNMLGIAFEAGFNSKTTFNTAFKKSTGQSPSEFASAGRK